MPFCVCVCVCVCVRECVCVRVRVRVRWLVLCDSLGLACRARGKDSPCSDIFAQILRSSERDLRVGEASAVSALVRDYLSDCVNE